MKKCFLAGLRRKLSSSTINDYFDMPVLIVAHVLRPQQNVTLSYIICSPSTQCVKEVISLGSCNAWVVALR
jgi:hypothetical protein